MKRIASLIFILVLGLSLRLFYLNSRPLGFTWDEAALGYNAYSLLKTGKDEYGKILPVIFKSFGDYKPGLYVYFTVPPVKIFGLNEFATRLPSAVFGTLTIMLVYLLIKEMFGIRYSVFGSLILAINPWAIHFSRGAWEANLALFLTTLAVLLFLKKRYLTSSIFLGLTFWAYQGAKMFTPLLILSLLIIYRPHIKKLIWPMILGLMILLPILWNFGSQSGRLKVFSIFSYTGDWKREVVQRYLNHLSPQYLFFTGDWSNLRHATPYYGYFHLPEILTILIGTVVLLRTINPSTKLLFGWLLLAILPASFSRDIVSGVRSLPMVVPLVIISGIGLAKLYNYKRWFLGFGIAMAFFMIIFLDLYFIHAPSFAAADWIFAYKPALQMIQPYLKDYRRVIFTDELGQPYIYVLFYYQVDPSEYQKSAKLTDNVSGDVGQVTTWDKFVFDEPDWPAQRGDTSTIFVGNQYGLPEQDMNPKNLIRIGEVIYPNGKHALRVVALQ